MISSLRLQNFRSYHDDSFEFDSAVNIIVGPNASGKTNLLEALLMTCRGSSYRTKDSELVQFGKSWARLDALTHETEQRCVKLVIEPNDKIQKSFIIGEHPFTRLSLSRTIPIILFEPNHLLLLHGSPQRRRDYLDDLLEQLVPGFATTRRHYHRTLAQRNALLKRGRDAGEQLFVWNIRLSELAGRMATARLQLVQELNLQLSKLYSKLSQQETEVELTYDSVVSVDQYSSDLLYKLERNHAIDIERGFTGYGPHRDDIVVTIGNHLAQESASRGEIRTLLLALKLIELSLIETQRGQPPILLLDDVFSELDGARRSALTETLATHQTFITTTDADVVGKNFSQAASTVLISR